MKHVSKTVRLLYVGYVCSTFYAPLCMCEQSCLKLLYTKFPRKTNLCFCFCSHYKKSICWNEAAYIIFTRTDRAFSQARTQEVLIDVFRCSEHDACWACRLRLQVAAAIEGHLLRVLLRGNWAEAEGSLCVVVPFICPRRRSHKID